MDLELMDPQEPVVGGQFFLEWDPAKVDLLGAIPGDPPFDFEIFESLDQAAGTLIYAVGDPDANPGTTVDTRLASLVFVASAESCPTDPVAIAFSFGPAPTTAITGPPGTPIPCSFVDAPPVTVDRIAPVVTTCPGDFIVPSDAGGCGAQVFWTPPTATDECGIATVTSSHLPGDVFPVGTTTVTVDFADSCGNTASCAFDVTVEPFAVLELEVDLVGSPAGPFERCITLDLSGGGGDQTTVTAELSFSGGGSGPVTVLVPCGTYDCISIRDPLHSLRRTVALGVSGSAYTAAATGPDALILGNLNDDGFIDILDFGVFAGQFGTPLPIDTGCSTPFPHADVSGDGMVDVVDFTFIQVEFLTLADAACPPPGPAPDQGQEQTARPPRVVAPVRTTPTRAIGPRVRVSVAELVRLIGPTGRAADLSGDGWVDYFDVGLLLAP